MMCTIIPGLFIQYHIKHLLYIKHDCDDYILSMFVSIYGELTLTLFND